MAFQGYTQYIITYTMPCTSRFVHRSQAVIPWSKQVPIYQQKKFILKMNPIQNAYING